MPTEKKLLKREYMASKNGQTDCMCRYHWYNLINFCARQHKHKHKMNQREKVANIYTIHSWRTHTDCIVLYWIDYTMGREKKSVLDFISPPFCQWTAALFAINKQTHTHNHIERRCTASSLAQHNSFPIGIFPMEEKLARKQKNWHSVYFAFSHSIIIILIIWNSGIFRFRSHFP